MTAFTHVPGVRRAATRGSVTRVVAMLVAGGCLLAAGCSASGTSASGPGFSGAHAPPGAGALPAAPAAPAAGKGTHLTGVLPAGQDIIYTASVTVRASDVRRAAARAAQLATSAGGYVSGETTRLDHAHPAQSTVSIQLKIPVAAYQSTLTALASGLGTRLALSQHAQDVTQTVADVASRVASEHAAITQLRRLLARAGSVSSLLMVQDQINQQESGLEALQSQQRVLAHQTAYGTVSLLLVSTRPPAAPRQVKLARGFPGGLAVGWQALRQVTSWLLTGAGAVLPFAALLALAAFGAWRARRWLRGRRARPRPAG